MATNTMLIDASHPEETRVVVLRGNRVEEFDFESAARRQLRGNIYLAKVTRVEPSLQAAFVDFGGNRHGFLAFSEIHPDYYQIPVADREALLAEEARSARGEDDEEENESRRKRRTRPRRGSKPARRRDEESVSEDVEAASNEEGDTAEAGRSEATEHDFSAAAEVETTSERQDEEEQRDEDERRDEDDGQTEDERQDEEDRHAEEDQVEQLGGGDALDEMSERTYRPRRQYKIQEVIKRRQVLLVQVVKEERGTKGAALTTYLSLAGRYSVLMPNTARGGGISRKITSAEDRKRLKSMAQDLEVPEGMGVILRTAGASRTKAEIKRDFEYLLRVWENVRELTLQSTAPSLVYEEGSLVKRAIRDLYSKDIEDVQVSGEEGYKEAKDFMRMLMPSHAKAVKPFREPQPLFARFGVEAQLDAMFNNVVTLKSGGYIVINQTEALVAIDVNSGRSTREHNIEDTALKTNLEAADEVARQLRLRDLAGLIVIDFIDMEEGRNNKSVERKVKEALKNDRARIQVGRISHFGLLEMSRQRIRTGVLESSTSPCPHCNGTGFLRSTPSLALHLVRAIEDTLLRNAAYNVTIRTRTEVAFYVLNNKRPHLRALEERFGVIITIVADDHLTGGQAFTLERGEPAAGPAPNVVKALATTVAMPEEEEEEYEEDIAAEDEEEASEEAAETAREGGERTREAHDQDDRGGRRRKRRRRRRGGRGFEREESGAELRTEESAHEAAQPFDGHDEDAGEDEGEGTESSGEGEETTAEGEMHRRRRRGRRGGRRNRPEFEHEESGATADISGPDEAEGIVASPPPAIAVDEPAEPVVAEPVAAEDAPAAKPKRTRKKAVAAEVAEEGAEPVKPARTRRKKTAEAVATPVVDDVIAEGATEVIVVEPKAEPQPGPEPVAAEPAKAPEPEIITPLVEVSDPNKPKRSGWWAKAKQVIGGE